MSASMQKFPSKPSHAGTKFVSCCITAGCPLQDQRAQSAYCLHVGHADLSSSQKVLYTSCMHLSSDGTLDFRFQVLQVDTVLKHSSVHNSWTHNNHCSLGPCCCGSEPELLVREGKLVTHVLVTAGGCSTLLCGRLNPTTRQAS